VSSGVFGVFGLFAMGRGVVFRGLSGVVLGFKMMAMRQMGMVGSFFVIALFVMLSRVSVVLRGLFMVLRSVAMMIGVFLRHGSHSYLRESVSLSGFTALSV
jgi:hypothetical protein